MKLLPALALTVATSTAFAVPPHAETEPKPEGRAIAGDPEPPKKPPLPRHCQLYDDMVKHLESEYGEHLIFSGINKGGKTLREIFVNVSTGSWSMTTVTPKKEHKDLVSCVISSGDGGQSHDAIKPHTV